MASINNYRIWCVTDSKWECVLGTGAPTVCPTDAAHTVVDDSIVVVERDVEQNIGVAKNLTLAEARTLRFKEIDARTVELIALGFTYASKQFSLSQPAQNKMTAAHQIKDHELFVYPVGWNTLDDHDTYAIASTADMSGFYMTAIGTIRARLDSGTAKKDLVRAAVDIAAIDAVVDDR